MSTKKHDNHPHLTGEHRLGDTIQLVLLLVFLGIWISDSFVWHFSTLPPQTIPEWLRIGLAGLVLFLAWSLARRGMRAVFGTTRSEPGVISTGVFKWIRHPIYTGAILFYLGATLITLSMASALFWLVIIGFYIWIAGYEEVILEEEFGEDYLNYKKKTGMLFPKRFR